MASQGNGPIFSWPALSAIATLFAIATGAGWAIFQTQLAAIQHQIDRQHEDSEKGIERLAREAVVKDQEVKNKIIGIDAELLRRRAEFVQVDAFKQFEERIKQYMATPFLKSSEFEAWKDGQKDLNLQFGRRLELLEQQKSPPR